MRIYSLYIGLILSLISCNHHLSLHKNQDDKFLNVINSILEYKKNYYHLDPKTCFKLNSEIKVDRKKMPYFTWHETYKHYLRDGPLKSTSYTKEMLGMEDLWLDYDKFKVINKQSFYLPQDTSVYKYCVRYMKKDHYPWGPNIDIITFPEGTLSFSPLLPTNKKGYYLVWVDVANDREQVYFMFTLLKQGNDWKVIHHYWDDWLHYEVEPEEDLFLK